MYDINRSNLLSINTMKMYLYDLAVLGSIKRKLENQLNHKMGQRSCLGRTRKFNDNEYRRRTYHYRDEYLEQYVFILVGIVILMGISIFTGAKWTDWVEVMLFKSIGETMSIIILIGICLAIPLIPLRFKYRKEEEEKRFDLLEEQRARERFEKEEDMRLQKESKQIVILNNEIKELEDKLCQVDREITAQFGKEILHKDYRDVRVCGVMFQLFDTGRVFTLTEAMNLYEDLKWKAEMKIMLQSLIEKVDDLLQIGRNLEYYSKCTMDNQIETNNILHEISMNQQQIQSNQEAIAMNTDIIRSNTDTIRMLEEFKFIQNERNK